MFEVTLIKLLLKKHISSQTIKPIAFKLAFIISGLCLLFYVPTVISQLIIVCYFLFTSYINFLESNKFWSQKEFLLLGFSSKVRTCQFYRTYLIQRFIIDGLIENICLIIGCGVLFLLKSPTSLYWYSITTLTHIVLQPAYFLLKENIKVGVSARILTDSIFILILTISTVLNQMTFINSYFLLPTFFDKVIFMLAHVFYIIVFYTIVLKVKSNFTASINVRSLLLPIKKYHIEVFKDLLLQRQELFIGPVSIIGYFIFDHFFAIDANNYLYKKIGILFFLLSFNLFSTRKEKHYALYASDTYFFADVRFLGIDKKSLWRSKFYTIHANSLLKIFCLFLFLQNNMFIFLAGTFGIINSSNYLFQKIQRKYNNKNNVLETLIQYLDVISIILICLMGQPFLLVIYVAITTLYNVTELRFGGSN